MNKEVEIKIQINQPTKEKVLCWLKKHGLYQGEHHQVDYYLNKPESPFFFMAPQGYKTANDYLRIRFTKKGDFLCFKRLHQDKTTGNPLYCDEYEVLVADGKKTLELLKAVGYTDLTIMDKKRTIYRYDTFEIALDQVEKLGHFMEVELKEEVFCPQKGMEKICKQLKIMGIERYTLQTRGYVSMLWNPNYDFGKMVEL